MNNARDNARASMNNKSMGGGGGPRGAGATLQDREKAKQRGKPQRRDGKKINDFRDVCASFQQLGTNIRDTRAAIEARAEKRRPG